MDIRDTYHVFGIPFDTTKFEISSNLGESEAINHEMLTVIECITGMGSYIH